MSELGPGQVGLSGDERHHIFKTVTRLWTFPTILPTIPVGDFHMGRAATFAWPDTANSFNSWTLRAPSNDLHGFRGYGINVWISGLSQEVQLVPLILTHQVDPPFKK